jgi:hypothetical protein
VEFNSRILLLATELMQLQTEDVDFGSGERVEHSSKSKLKSSGARHQICTNFIQLTHGNSLAAN